MDFVGPRHIKGYGRVSSLNLIDVVSSKAHIQQVKGDGTISVLNEDFYVGESLAYEYVWATIDTKQE